MKSPRVAVLGAGVVGLACAYHLYKAGLDVRVIDPDPDGDKASVGNAGGIAVTEVVPASTPGVWWRAPGWMLDPLGPLAVRVSHAIALLPWLARFTRCGTHSEIERISRALAALNGRVYEDLVPLLDEVGHVGHLHRTGALSVYETQSGFDRDAKEWQLKRARGIVTEEMTGDEARALEPALGPGICRAVFMPQWSHVSDPRWVLEALRDHLRGRGVVFNRDEVRDIRQAAAAPLALDLASGTAVSVDAAVVAAGAWSARLARRCGDRVLLESERGYNATLPDAGIVVGRQLIFAERKFVATPLSCGLRIGGAAEFGGLKAVANYQRSQALLTLARRYLPGLRTDHASFWAGHRPATPDSLPVIGSSKRRPGVFYAFGHGHLGLTQAATTGHLIAEAVLGRPPSIDMTPYAIDRFE